MKPQLLPVYLEDPGTASFTRQFAELQAPHRRYGRLVAADPSRIAGTRRGGRRRRT
jgi:hypothetical protein